MCSWTELHPRLLGVPELSRVAAEYCVSALDLLDKAVAMRASNRPKVNQSTALLECVKPGCDRDVLSVSTSQSRDRLKMH